MQKQSPSRSWLPQLTTPGGITFGSTIAQARSAYSRLRLTGAEKWETQTGITLVTDGNIGTAPPNQIYEIKVGACGDF